MKYPYIISIILSSFFIYKSAFANIYPQQYAFFIPGGAFQQNQEVQDIRLMRPRYVQTEEESQANQPQPNEYPTATINSVPPQRKTSTTSQATSATSNLSSTSLKTKKKSTLPITGNSIKSVQKIKVPTTKTAPQTSTNIIFPADNSYSEPTPTKTITKQEKYQLDENTKLATPQQEQYSQPKLTYKEELKQKSLSSLLNKIPYPDSSQPKFKQLYSYYGMELRVYQNRGKFPRNSEQEETLAKANSIKRFDVK